MNTFHYDAFGNLLSRPSVSGSERGSGSTSKVLASGAALLHSDGVYDGTLARFYLGAVRPKHLPGLFTSHDVHAGVVIDPAHLQRFGYASESPVEITDPA